MKKIDWKAPVIIFFAFVMSSFVQLLGGRLLGLLLPPSLAGERALFALLVRMLFSVLIIIAAVRLLHRRGKES